MKRTSCIEAYEALSAEHNALVVQYNALVDTVNKNGVAVAALIDLLTQSGIIQQTQFERTRISYEALQDQIIAENRNETEALYQGETPPCPD